MATWSGIQLKKLFSRTKYGSIFLLLALTGCGNAIQYLLPMSPTKEKLQMTVAPAGSPGRFTLIGSTNLPNNSRVAIAALRYLRPTDADALNLNSNVTYSVIAYKNADVVDGKWQANLNLWQVAPTGEYKEAWQLEQPKLKLSLVPIKEVTFVATVTRAGQTQKLIPSLNKQFDRLANNFIKFTDKGEIYAHISKVLPVDLPSGKTTPPKPKLEDVNFGWGDRYIIKPEHPNITELKVPDQERRRTNAPISPAEFMR